MMVTAEELQKIVEAALMIAGRPLTVQNLQKLFDEQDAPSTQAIRAALKDIENQYANSGIELKEVASGFQFQARSHLSPWLTRLWEERPPRYSRAFLETLALIAYRQPITRAEIEEIRGVTVNSQIIKTLLEREWIRIVGYRDVPGKPGIYGTTKQFLDHFNLKSLDELPTLSELRNFEAAEAELQIQLELANQDAASPQTETLNDTSEVAAETMIAEEESTDLHE